MTRNLVFLKEIQGGIYRRASEDDCLMNPDIACEHLLALIDVDVLQVLFLVERVSVL